MENSASSHSGGLGVTRPGGMNAELRGPHPSQSRLTLFGGWYLFVFAFLDLLLCAYAQPILRHRVKAICYQLDGFNGSNGCRFA
jgi:hypothetical protein